MTDEAPLTRSERLLTLLVLNTIADASQAEKCVLLNRAGLSNSDIAELLNTSPATVTQSLYTSRKATGKRKVAEGTRKPPKRTTKKLGR